MTAAVAPETSRVALFWFISRRSGRVILSIPVSKLRPVAILADGDLHALAVLQLRCFDALATSRRTTGTKRPTVSSLATNFVHLFPEVERWEVVEKLEECGLNMDDAIMWDNGWFPGDPT
jgi:hypothetical protein